MRRDIDNENADMIAAVEAEDAKRVARLCEEVMAALRGVDAPMDTGPRPCRRPWSLHGR